MPKETRSIELTEIRTYEDKPRTFSARVVNYGVRDSYGTSWAPKVFARSMEEQPNKPVVMHHDWTDPIGHVVGFSDGPEGLDIEVELDDFDAVPSAKRAYAQLRSGTLSQFSFAFERRADEPDPELRDTTRITDAEVDEFSVVLRGSVPGTKVLAVRSDEAISRSAAADIVTRFAANQIDLQEALTELKDGSARMTTPKPLPPDPPTEPAPPLPNSDVVAIEEKLHLLSGGK